MEGLLMTEAEWLACADARLMVAFVRARLSDRKARLLACVAAAMALPVVGTRNRRKLRSASDQNPRARTAVTSRRARV